ncbi:MAG TPA: hypothetical protein VIF62_07590 [Labilithrix sp.]
MRQPLRAVSALSMLVAVAACSGGSDSSTPPLPGSAQDPSNGGSGPVTIGPDGVPVGADGKPIPPKLDGTYSASTMIDLTTSPLLPQQVSTAMSALAHFHDHPMQGIIDILTTANVPVVGDFLNALPSIVRNAIASLFDNHVAKTIYQDVPFADNLANLVGDVGGLATHFELVSTLVVPPVDSLGNAKGMHTVEGIAFHWGDKREVVDAPSALVQLEAMPVNVNAIPLATRSPQLEMGRLTISDHSFPLPIGAFVVLGADKLAQDLFGAKDIRDALGRVVDCHTVAQNVSKECVGIDPVQVCVGHASDIENFCNSGLDTIVSAVQSGLKMISLPLLHMKMGTGQMWDQPADGGPLDAVADRIDNGFWSMGVGKEDKPVAATFTGVRITSAAAH